MRIRLGNTLRWAALIALGVLAGCAEGAGPTPGESSVSGKGDCARMKAEMDRMVAQGKTGGKAYTDVLDRYLGNSCERGW